MWLPGLATETSLSVYYKHSSDLRHSFNLLWLFPEAFQGSGSHVLRSSWHPSAPTPGPALPLVSRRAFLWSGKLVCWLLSEVTGVPSRPGFVLQKVEARPRVRNRSAFYEVLSTSYISINPNLLSYQLSASQPPPS